MLRNNLEMQCAFHSFSDLWDISSCKSLSSMFVQIGSNLSIFGSFSKFQKIPNIQIRWPLNWLLIDTACKLISIKHSASWHSSKYSHSLKPTASRNPLKNGGAKGRTQSGFPYLVLGLFSGAFAISFQGGYTVHSIPTLSPKISESNFPVFSRTEV